MDIFRMVVARVCGHLIVGIAVSLVLVSANAAVPDIAAFASPESMRMPEISPDGRYLAYVSVHEGRRVALTTDLTQNGPSTPVIYLEPESEFDFGWCEWANDTRLLCGFLGAGPRGFYRDSRIVAVNADGSDQRVLTKYPYMGYLLLDVTPDDPNTVLVERAGAPDVLKINIYTGRVEILERANLNQRFRTDGQGNIRLALAIRGNYTIFSTRDNGTTTWRELTKARLFDEANEFVPIAVIPGSNRAYATGPADGRIGLYEIDLLDMAPPKVVFSHPLSDVVATYMERGRLLGIKYETDRPFVYYTDPHSLRRCAR